MLIAENDLRKIITMMLKEQFSDFAGAYEDMSGDNEENKDYDKVEANIIKEMGENALKLPKAFAETFDISIEVATLAIDGAMRKIFPDPNTRKKAYNTLSIVAPPLVAGAAALYASDIGKKIFKAAGTFSGLFMFAAAGPLLMYHLIENLQTVETKLKNMRKLTNEPLSKKHIKSERDPNEYKGFGSGAKDFTYQEFVSILAAQNVEELARDANYGKGANIATRLYNNKTIGDEMYKDILNMTRAIRDDIKSNKQKLLDVKKTAKAAASPHEDLAISYITSIDLTGVSSKAFSAWKRLS